MLENIIDPQISLDPASHTYSHSEHPDIEFTSCTRVVGAFFEPFDAPAIAKNLTEKHPKYLGMTPEELQQQWRDNADYGSLVHGEIDAFIRHKTAPVEEPSKAGVDWLQKQPWDQVRSFDIEYSIRLIEAGAEFPPENGFSDEKFDVFSRTFSDLQLPLNRFGEYWQTTEIREAILTGAQLSEEDIDKIHHQANRTLTSNRTL